MGAKIRKIGVYLPKKVLSNIELAQEFDRWSPIKIEEKIGIRERHIAADDETAGDLAFKAAESVLKTYEKDKVDMLLLCTQSPDYFLPTTACILQERLKLKKSTGAFDFNLGCSGFIYGLAMAKAFINCELANSVLLITAETYSKHIHPKDLANRTIFGDGAAATIIEKDANERIFNFILGTDGTGKNNLIVKVGGLRSRSRVNCEEKITDSGDIYSDSHLFMNGPDIFNFTIEAVPAAVDQCLMKNNMKIDEIDYFVFHQANKYIIEYLRMKIGIPEEKFYENMLSTGNTVSSTIPIALADLIEKNKIKSGNKVLLCGFGVGYSWGAVILEI